MTDISFFQSIHDYRMRRVRHYRRKLAEAERLAMDSGFDLQQAKEQAGMAPKPKGIFDFFWRFAVGAI